MEKQTNTKEQAMALLKTAEAYMLFTLEGEKASCTMVGAPAELSATIAHGLLTEDGGDARLVMMAALMGALQIASKKSKED